MPQSQTQPTAQPLWRRALPCLAVYGAVVVLALVAFGPGVYERWLIGCVDDPKAPFCGLILDTAGIDSAQVIALVMKHEMQSKCR